MDRPQRPPVGRRAGHEGGAAGCPQLSRWRRQHEGARADRRPDQRRPRQSGGRMTPAEIAAKVRAAAESLRGLSVSASVVLGDASLVAQVAAELGTKTHRTVYLYRTA